MKEDLAGKDLRHHDLSGKTMFEVDLRGAKLYGAKISLTCEQFDGVKLDDDQVGMLLLMISEADIDHHWKRDIYRAVLYKVGEVRYTAMRKLLRLI